MNIKIFLHIFSMLLTVSFVILCSLKLYQSEYNEITTHASLKALNVSRYNNSDFIMNNSSQKPSDTVEIRNDENKTRIILSIKQLEEFYSEKFVRTVISEINKIENLERKNEIFELFNNKNITVLKEFIKKEFIEKKELDKEKYVYQVTESDSCNKKYYEFIHSHVWLDSPCNPQNFIATKDISLLNKENIKHLLVIMTNKNKCREFIRAYNDNILCKCKSIKHINLSKALCETELDICCKQKLSDNYTMKTAPHSILYDIFEKNELEKCLNIEEDRLEFYTEEEKENIELIKKSILKE